MPSERGAQVTTAELMAAAGCSASTLSRWVERKLLPPCSRVGLHTGGMTGYYPPESLERVKEIVRMRGMGYSLAQIKTELDGKRKKR
jgi:DNA-binding transcriptional MerR regulator